MKAYLFFDESAEFQENTTECNFPLLFVLSLEKQEKNAILPLITRGRWQF